MLDPEVLKSFAAARGLLFTERRAQDLCHAYVYSQDMRYRYAYFQSWNAALPLVLWVMLNPGTGETEMRRRNTLERCKQWSRSWGYGGLLIGNAFAFRTKAARELKRAPEPTNFHNDEALSFLAANAQKTIVAWGNGGALEQRSQALAPILRGARCLGVTKRGEPRHPLYVSSSASLAKWNCHAPSNTDA